MAALCLQVLPADRRPVACCCAFGRRWRKLQVLSRHAVSHQVKAGRPREGIAGASELSWETCKQQRVAAVGMLHTSAVILRAQLGTLTLCSRDMARSSASARTLTEFAGLLHIVCAEGEGRRKVMLLVAAQAVPCTVCGAVQILSDIAGPAHPPPPPHSHLHCSMEQGCTASTKQAQASSTAC